MNDQPIEPTKAVLDPAANPIYPLNRSERRRAKFGGWGSKWMLNGPNKVSGRGRRKIGQ